MSRLRQEGPALAVLGLILAVGLVLRVLHNDHGLPYVYYVDEGSHFTKRAIEVFRDPNPGYFQNPSAFTYLLHVVYRLAAIPAGGNEAVIDAYKTNASWVFEVSRTLAAVLCLAGVGAVYAAGRALWDRRTGLLAAAVLCFAFLPVAFSRMALTDTGTLAPVAVAVWLSIRMAEGAGLRTAALAGVAVGLAIGFKYTAGLILLAPVLALLLRRDGAYALRGGLAVLAGALVAFALTNPFFFLDFDRALHQLRGQAELAGNQGKFGQEDETGVLYYLDSLLWGLGYVAAAASLAGAVLLARRDRARAALLLVFPVALFLYLSFQSRFFGRWLLPVYPALALLAGYAIARGAEALRERAPRWEAPALAVTCAVLLWQPLAADARSMAVLGHEDTRAIARDWLAAHHRPRAARGDRARGARALLLARRRRQAAQDGAPAVRQRVRARHAGGARGVRPDAGSRPARPLPPPRLLHRGDDGAHPRAGRRARQPGRGRVLRPAGARVGADLPDQPLPAGLRAAGVLLRPLLLVLLARLRAARPGRPGPPPRRLHAGLRRVTRRSTAIWLGGILLAALALRLWNLDHGLPFAYNADEAEHFVPHALDIAGGGGLDPGYYENPPALTYLLALVYWIGGTADAFLTARVVVALIGTLVVALTFFAGQRAFDPRTGLLAAALMAVAFLPVFYSKHALNDVVTLAPVTDRADRRAARVPAGPLGRLPALRRGDRHGDRGEVHGRGDAAHARRRGRAAAPARPVGAAARAPRLRGRRRGLPGAVPDPQPVGAAGGERGPRPAARAVGPGGHGQARPGRRARLGLLRRDARLGPRVAAARRGGGRRGRRDPPRLAPRAAAARLPRRPLPLHGLAGPLLRPLAAARLPRAVHPRRLRGRRARDRAEAPGAAHRWCSGPRCAPRALLASVHVDRVLGREDTRAQALDWLTANVPPGGKVVVEPFVPAEWAEEFDKWPVERPFQAYEKRLRVRDIEAYRAGGYCFVVVGSTQKGRGLKAGLRSSRRYYAALDEASEETVTFSPYRDGADPVEFSYDFSFNYAPRAFERPGPVVEIHRLRDCG